jgi:ferredoxin
MPFSRKKTRKTGSTQGTSLGPFVCGARACSLCSLKMLNSKHKWQPHRDTGC